MEASKPLLELQPELLSRAPEEPEPFRFRDRNAKARGYLDDMTQYCRENVDKYLAAVGKPESSLRRAATPFIDESRAVPDMLMLEGVIEGTQRPLPSDDKHLNVSAA